MKNMNIPLGRLLIQLGYINEKDLETALATQKKTPGKKLGDIIIEMGLVSERDMMMVLKDKLDVPFVNLDAYSKNEKAIEYISEDVARKYTIFPIDIKDNTIAIAMNDPLDYYSLEDVKMITGKDILPVLATRSQVLAAIDKYYAQKRYTSTVDKLNEGLEASGAAALADRETTGTVERVDNSPIVKLVNSIVGAAYSKNASDIHLEPHEGALVVRMRIDGELVESMRVTSSVLGAVVARVKIMSNLNIAEKRVPQDGQFRFTMPNEYVDVRVSTIPTVNGEKIVMRLLSTREQRKILGVNDLGLNTRNLKTYRELLKVPHGVILITGPTGSGKSTTLYSTLNEMNCPNVNITTVEDPVERNIEGINQVQVNAAAGLTFAAGLRSILRQDPDIIMIGEIRDTETAQIAVRSAITGHKVFSTLHTNDAVSSVSRLIDMGIEPYLVVSALTGVVAQRLVKNICPACKTEYQPDETETALLQKVLGERGRTAKLWKGKGCPSCGGSGYCGRSAVHEIMPFDAKIRAMIMDNAPAEEISRYVREHYSQTLAENIGEMVLGGITTVEELVKVTYTFG